MEKVQLSSGQLRVIAIKRKTKASLYEYVKVGDILTYEMSLSGYWNYASNVLVSNVTQGTSMYKTLEKASMVTSCFELEAVVPQ